MFDILHRVGVRAPLEEVFTALATAEGVSRWWTQDTEGGSALGDVLVTRFHADGKLLGGFDLKIIERHPQKSLVWEVVAGPEEWLGTKIRFDLKREEDFSVILFQHEGWKEPVEFMYHCSTKWAVFLMSLKSYVETGKGSPSPDDVRISNWH